MLRRLFKPRSAKLDGEAVYAAAAAQARQPALYRDYGAPDRIDVRFELYTIHLGLLLRRLSGGGEEAAEVSQAAMDTYVSSLDDVLRGIGVGDLSMSKKMKKLAGTLVGRLQTLNQALDDSDRATLADFLARNIYDGDAERAAPMAGYVVDAAAALAAQPLKQIMKGRVEWPAIRT